MEGLRERIRETIDHMLKNRKVRGARGSAMLAGKRHVRKTKTKTNTRPRSLSRGRRVVHRRAPAHKRTLTKGMGMAPAHKRSLTKGRPSVQRRAPAHKRTLTKGKRAPVHRRMHAEESHYDDEYPAMHAGELYYDDEYPAMHAGELYYDDEYPHPTMSAGRRQKKHHKRAPTEYNLFVKDYLDAGHSMADAAADWRARK